LAENKKNDAADTLGKKKEKNIHVAPPSIEGKGRSEGRKQAFLFLGIKEKKEKNKTLIQKSGKRCEDRSGLRR